MAHWRFMDRDRSTKERNPPLEWFFNLDVMDNASEPLVREGIQNSLDARVGSGPVRVRIYLSEDDQALSPKKLAPFVSGFRDHLRAKSNGLERPPAAEDPCPFIVFEDFGTTGLGGEPNADRVPEGTHNAFYHFFRAEGSSSKGEGKLGRFGIGKFAFPLCSRARAVLALTHRLDGRQLMAGVATLKCHVVEGKAYQPDGWFGDYDDEDDFQLPLEYPADILRQFQATFGLARGEEPGLSVVIPYYSPEEVTAVNVAKAVIRHFFLPVIQNKLVVEVSSPTIRQSITAGSVHAVLSWLRSVSRKDDERELDVLTAVVNLAEASVKHPDPDAHIPMPSKRGAHKWEGGFMKQSVREVLARKLQDGQILFAKFHLRVLPRVGEPKPDSFDVLIQEDPEGEYSKPVFVRNGNVIANVGHSLKGHRVIVSVPDGPLSDALGMAENVAHTEWRKGSQEFKDLYRYSASHVDYVVKAAGNLVKEIHATDAEVDFSALADLFPDLAAPDSGLGKKPKLKKGRSGKTPSDPPPPPPPPKPKRYSLARTSGGFSVSKGSPEAVMPEQLDVRFAYALRRGDPLTRFHPADFDLTKKGLNLAVEGAQFEVIGPNVLCVTELTDDFKVTVTGFDSNRDLFVAVKVRS